ncbi:3-oxoacyl-[acyl-carrier-protein] synthase III [Amphiplicatus metriothermophilus]|uniref:Beta-ketoacyl-[acyl-carrier-protein] synthase III n=1 Tax=Amphiplicatus metriothermophilus TaxID=1519374 RepID=A0A239PQ17_9PROT|nr:beta-ketoacyl-ACP synthase III [Amphiplicatus metriothermophilus]MBB5518700.1 3-oxoacyl-[acyl-carrier-protein] synthase-3 [Amphiplicatus metriothermophilus]SNT72143.1 3-oxoacyl-[acyl-carrier-protein] synthase III [Amphiplicatus metriothermophilus]
MVAAVESVISGVGAYLPERIVTNHDLAEIVDTSDEWIRTRSGIEERRFAADDEATSDLAARAAWHALDQAGLKPRDIGLVVVATVTPDRTFPATAVYVQRKLGVPRGIAFDISAACAGFLYALTTAHGFVSSGQVRHALVIGADKLSCFLDWSDRATCVLFGDGAGAVVLSGEPPRTAAPPRGVLATYLSADGRLADHLYADGGPSTTGTVGKVRMNGKEVFRNAVELISDAVFKVTEQANVARGEIDWFVPHQANIRIIEACAKRLELEQSRIVVTIGKHANTSSASIPLALDAAVRDGRVRRDQLLVFAALGGGLAWGSALARY